MELQLLSSTFTFSIFVFLVVAVKLVQGPKGKNSSIKFPPGPWRLPLIGNMHQLVGNSLTHHILRDLAKSYGPLMHLQVGEISFVVISSKDIVEAIIKTNDTIISDRPYLLSFDILSYNHKDIVFAPYGNYWRQMRKISALQLLSTKRVKSFHSIREKEVSSLIKAICFEEGSIINLSQKIVDLSFGIIARAAFGNRTRDQQAFISAINEVINVTSNFHMSDFYPSMKLEIISGMKSKVEKVHREIDRILQNILKDHRDKNSTTKSDMGAKVQEDLVDVLLKLQDNDDLEFPLMDTNIKAIMWNIFFGGGDTTSTTIEWAMAEMLKNPMVMKEAQAEVRNIFYGKGNVDESDIHELKFLKLVIKETLRLHPAGPLSIPRGIKQSFVINGYEIPARSRLIFNLWAIGRDPKYWNEAEKFHPERFLDSSIDYKGADLEYIPFGVGRRICPGISFAMPNIELTLAQLLYHFDWKFPNEMEPEDLDMTEQSGMIVRRKNELLLIPTLFHRSSMVKQGCS